MCDKLKKSGYICILSQWNRIIFELKKTIASYNLEWILRESSLILSYSMDHIRVSDSDTSSDLLLEVDDYRNIRIYDNFMKEYVVLEVDDLKQV